jgi:hypothetical protein
MNKDKKRISLSKNGKNLILKEQERRQNGK